MKDSISEYEEYCATDDPPRHCKYLEFRYGGLYGYDGDYDPNAYGFFCNRTDRKKGDCIAECDRCGFIKLVDGDVPEKDIGEVYR